MSNSKRQKAKRTFACASGLKETKPEAQAKVRFAFCSEGFSRERTIDQ
jgi:hypothetical protein